MEISEVKFVKSSPGLGSCPTEHFPEYAFAGRSNVGKSTLLNALAGMKNLAKTSSTPGKTQLINHFLVDDAWYLVDLPGYGYARTGRKTRDSFLDRIQEYLLNRKTLACLFVLIDCRHSPLQSDLSFIQWTGEKQVPIALVFTKSDKLSHPALQSNLDLYRKTLLETWESLPPVFAVSSKNKTGLTEILKFINETNVVFRS